MLEELFPGGVGGGLKKRESGVRYPVSGKAVRRKNRSPRRAFALLGMTAGERGEGVSTVVGLPRSVEIPALSLRDEDGAPKASDSA